MSAPIKPFAVRILNEAANPVGAGVLIANGHVITCAHVVIDAAGAKRASAEPPDVGILLDFPWVPQAGRHRATIKVWRYRPGIAAEDIAVLELDETPDACSSALFSAREDLNGHEFDAWGYIAGHPLGVWSNGELGHDNPSGLLQLTNRMPAGYRVQPGFSGGPVWDRQLKKVVGIIVTSEVDPDIRTSFLIPTRLLSAVYGKMEESILSPTQDLITSEDHDSLSQSGPHTIVIKAMPDGKLLWKGGIGPARIGDLWRGRTNYEIAYEPALTRYRDVVDALLRVAIHGAGGSLYVSEPDRWKERAKLAINSCLGTRWDHASPAVGPANDDAWGLLPYCDYQDCEVPFERQYAPDELETIIHAKLDFSLLDGIRDAASRALQDRDFTQLGLEHRRGLARSMWDVW